MHDDYDRSSKWLIQHHGDSVLRMAGIEDIASWRPLPPEVVQPRQLPDGLLEVHRKNHATTDLFLLEMATYPEARLLEQLARGLMLVYLDRRQVPEALALILCPRGVSPAPAHVSFESPLGHAELQARWRVVQLRDLRAEALLAANEIGLIPWTPLARFDGLPEHLLRECKQRLDHLADATERGNLLAVTQVLARLRYNDPRLLGILGGKDLMIESPLIQEIVAESKQEMIIRALSTRFGILPPEISVALQPIQDRKRLNELMDVAVQCSSLAAFQAALQA